MKTALIFRRELLPPSETFVAAQAASLREYAPVFAGLRVSHRSLTLPGPRIMLANGEAKAHKLRAAAYEIAQIAPRFHAKLQHCEASVLHAHFATDGVTAAGLAEKIHVPLVTTLHGYDVSIPADKMRPAWRGKLFQSGLEHLWENCSHFICVSEHIRSLALSAGFPAAKMSVIYTGIDLSLFTDIPGTSEREPESSTVLFVGRLVEKKGVRYLLQAMQIVQDAVPGVRLVLAGAGPLQEELEEIGKQLGIHCEWLGLVDSQQVRDAMHRCSLLCIPSVTAKNGDSEGLGMVIAEAMASGLPVIGSSSGGIPEIVTSGVTGLLCPERDVPLLAEHLITVLLDRDLRTTMGREGRRAVEKHFDLAVQTKLVEEIYGLAGKV